MAEAGAPRKLACADPVCAGDEHQDVLLSRTGRVWSFTTMDVPPPKPYARAGDAEPFILAAVELEAQSIVVLGQMVAGTAIDQVRVGLPVELVEDVLYEDDEHEYTVWNWRPTDDEARP